jgi:hypothetical protein
MLSVENCPPPTEPEAVKIIAATAPIFANLVGRAAIAMRFGVSEGGEYLLENFADFSMKSEGSEPAGWVVTGGYTLNLDSAPDRPPSMTAELQYNRTDPQTNSMTCTHDTLIRGDEGEHKRLRVVRQYAPDGELQCVDGALYDASPLTVIAMMRSAALITRSHAA